MGTRGNLLAGKQTRGRNLDTDGEKRRRTGYDWSGHTDGQAHFLWEAPAGRRSLCYDETALQKRIKNPPAGSALGQAEKMGVTLMNEALYRRL